MTERVLSQLMTFIACFLFHTGSANNFPISVNHVMCEGKSDPMGVDLTGVHFGWILCSSIRNSFQTSYQIIISSSLQRMDQGKFDMWNSQRIRSNESISVAYAGSKLTPGKTYYWRVRVWNRNGKPSQWSSVGKFTTGLFTSGDWGGAKWIGYEAMDDSMRLVPGVDFNLAMSLGSRFNERSIIPLFRKSFKINKAIRRATIFVTGLGQYEISINGQKTGNSFLSPGWTDYDKRCLYNIYDVTGQVKGGNNVIGLIVGNGFYNISRERYYKLIVAFGYPRMICKLAVEYDDGSSDVIVSDSSWKTCASPIKFSSIYGGEDYDAMAEQKAWTLPDFNDLEWKNALIVRAPLGKLLPESDFPLTIADTIPVKSIYKINCDTYSYDFGQNVSGIIELKVKGHRGDTVKLTPSELIDDDKRPNQRASGEPYFFTYILKGEDLETWRPKFTYYGFRYVLVEHAAPSDSSHGPGLISIVKLTSLHTRNSSAQTGSFHCSNDLFNRINELIKWAIKSNMQSIITDCPHREKLGWLEQDYLMGTSIQYNYNIRLLYKNIVADMMDAQTAGGLVPDIAPEFVKFDGGFRDSPEWGSASVILPWLLYKWYGDKETLRNAYDMMKNYIGYLERKSNSYILNYGLGDWYDYGPNFPGEAQLTPKSLTATAMYYYDVDLMSKMALLLGRQSDAVTYKKRASTIKAAFNRTFFHSNEKVYSTGSQTAMALPLCVGLVDKLDRQAVAKNMIDSIKESDYKLTAGDIGFHFLIGALSENNGSQIIYSMNNRKDVPGYGFQLERGATTLTESWAALKEVSNNHLMLGHIMEWFYDGIGGIKQKENSIAYKHIVIAPTLVGELKSASVAFQCPYGTIKSEWRKDANHFRLHVDIPVNTKADIYLPGQNFNSVREGGFDIKNNKDIKMGGVKDGKTKIEVGSGAYDFQIDL